MTSALTSPSSSNFAALDTSNQLITFNAADQLPMKLSPSHYPSLRSQFQSLLLGYDLLGYTDSTLPCPSTMIIKEEPNDAKASAAHQTISNLAYLYRKRQDQLLFHAILASSTEAVVPFLASSKTSQQEWEKILNPISTIP